MLVVVFTYNREEMLQRLYNQTIGKFETLIIDDGSDWLKHDYEPHHLRSETSRIIRTAHEGKKGFWKKWLIAQQIALGTSHEYFLFIQDDLTDIDFNWLNEVTKQGWEKSLFAINVLNDKRTECWGKFSTGQQPFEISGRTLNEVGFVDCNFLTNRFTLENCPIHEVPDDWFDRDDKSSGVGAQMTRTLRGLKCRMMTPTPTVASHGNHFSQMHGEHREASPLLAGGFSLPTYCINLNSRPEKWKATVKECMKIQVTPKRFTAIKRTPGFEGCRLSHLKLLKGLKKHKTFFIIEDDVLFCVENPLGAIKEAMNELPVNWDMLYLGATLNKPLQRYSDHLFRLTDAWTTHAMIFNNQNGVVDYILDQNGGGRKIDVFLRDQVQTNFNCYVTWPMIATQRPGYSDIVNKDVDYHEINNNFERFTEKYR